jgi:hypothetical protein
VAHLITNQEVLFDKLGVHNAAELAELEERLTGEANTSAWSDGLWQPDHRHQYQIAAYRLPLFCLGLLYVLGLRRRKMMVNGAEVT